MPYKEREVEEKEAYPVKNRMTDEELRKLDNELKPYYYRRKVFWPTVEEVELLDTEKWLIDRSAMTKSGVVVHVTESGAYEPILYTQLMEDLEQWKRWRSKNAFVDKQKIEALSKMAADHYRAPKIEDVENS